MKKVDREYHGMGSPKKAGVDKATAKFYRTWGLMKNRCMSKDSPSFSKYGGRGIKVSERWLHFSGFYEDMYSPFLAHVLEYGLGMGTTLDRIDNNGDYCKENCRWATMTDQANNRRNSSFLTLNNVRLTVCQWAKKIGIGRSTIEQRIKYGWSVKDALTKPVIVNKV